MTTANSAIAKIQQPEEFFVFPDPPEIPEDQMTNFDHLAANGNVHHLALHLGNPDTTLVAGERYLALTPTQDMTGLRYPDLLIACGVEPAAYHRRRAYVISDQGKPPDFVMEVASPSTRRTDATDKRNDYAALGIPEYWRFDETIGGRLPKLAGDRLADGQYEPIPIEEIAEGVLQGYSQALHLYLRWVRGELEWHDPATGRHILTFDDERARADHAEAELIAATARIAELEEQLRSQDT
jgi:Uma2 family endonuclease